MEFRNAARAALAGAAIVTAAFGARAEEDCVISDTQICDGCRVELHVMMSRNTTCDLIYGIRGQVLSVKVIEKPKNGVAGVAGNGRWIAYRPHPGFSGNDRYVEVMEWRHRDSGRPRRVTVTTHIQVR